VNKTLLAVDGMAYVYRAYYAVPPMSNVNGVPTNAVFGFVRILQKIIADVIPDFVVVAFDTKEPTFRHKQYEAYKAQRPPMPDELVQQLPWIKEYVQTLNIPCLEYPGYEADDVLATLAVCASARDVNTLIATADKDLCQLVSDRIGILQAGFNSSEVLDAERVTSKFGVSPRQIVDYLALVGDSADNIPGVEGIGPKTAAKLLQQFDTLDGIYAHIEELTGKAKERLLSAREFIATTKKLLQVDCAVPIREVLDDLHVKEPDRTKLQTLRAYLNFRTPLDSSAHAILRDQQMELF